MSQQLINSINEEVAKALTKSATDEQLLFNLGSLGDAISARLKELATDGSKLAELKSIASLLRSVSPPSPGTVTGGTCCQGGGMCCQSSE
jgi:hypothetical protein